MTKYEFLFKKKMLCGCVCVCVSTASAFAKLWFPTANSLPNLHVEKGISSLHRLKQSSPENISLLTAACIFSTTAAKSLTDPTSSQLTGNALS